MITNLNRSFFFGKKTWYIRLYYTQSLASRRPASEPAEVISLAVKVGSTTIPAYLHMPAGAGPFRSLAMAQEWVS